MKKLLAIAVAAALTAPAAMADTTLYGKLHASVDNTQTTAAGVKTTDNVVNSNTSRIGIKGATALDNGLEATYGLEYGLSLDGQTTVGNSTRTLSARNTFAGLKGKFGEVRVGRHDTPAKLATSGFDTFADTTASDMSRIILADNERVDNAVAYINKFGPVTVAAAHSTGIDTSVVKEIDAAGEANSVMAAYGNGPWTASIGHSAINGIRKNTNVGLGWKAEAGHNVGLVYETAKADTAATGATATSSVIGGAGGKDTNIYLGGGYKMGNVTLKAAVGQGKSKTAAGVSTGGTEKLTTVGVDYSLGKKTSVYALFADNKNMLRLNSADAAASAATDRQKAASIGLVTEF